MEQLTPYVFAVSTVPAPVPEVLFLWSASNTVLAIAIDPGLQRGLELVCEY